MLRLRIVAVTLMLLAEAWKRFGAPALKAVWGWRKAIAIAMATAMFCGVVLVISMHAFVLEPRQELRTSGAAFFDVSATLFEATRGEPVVRDALYEIAGDAPNSWTRSNISRWAEAHGDAELLERVTSAR